MKWVSSVLGTGLRLSGIQLRSPSAQHAAILGQHRISLHSGSVYVALGWAAACSPLCSDVECCVRLD